MRYLFLLLLLPVCTAYWQKARISETTRSMKTYPYSDPDPVPHAGRVYPYFRFDGFTNEAEMRDWKIVEMENDYIRIGIMPEMGGKVWEAIEKSCNWPFIFSTKEVKFRDISLRGAWTTGGMEFNFGDIGHATTCSTPVDYFIRSNTDGSVSCFTGATEWASGTTWRVEIRLEPGKAYFTAKAWWYNSTPVEQEFYHWVNTGFKAEGDLEFIFPGTHHIGHSGEYDTWPYDSAGRDLSFYRNNNFGSYKSYHITGKPSAVYGGYWHDDEMGFGRYAPYYEKLGRKVWILGLSQEGERWENLLTDGEGLNVELQSGRLFNQAAGGSEMTPFKHVGFAPYATDSWSDTWFPVKHTRGMTHATLSGALNLRVQDTWLKIDWMALGSQSDTLSIRKSGTIIFQKKLDLRPMELFRDSVRWTGSTDDLCVTFGQDLITSPAVKPLARPLKSPANFDWNSEYGLLLRGTDLSRQKDYIEAEQYLMKALGKNPCLVPALSAMAQLRYRQGLYAEARDFAGRGLAVDTYDPASNYFWGLANELCGSEADAFDGYSVATLSPEYRKAAWYRLACLKIKERNMNEAAGLLGKLLANYSADENAAVVLALVERKRGNAALASEILDKQLETDPLNHMARFEKYMLSGKEKERDEFTGLIRQELPWETYTELALQYYSLNLDDEALEVLDLAPVHPMVNIIQAWILDRSGFKEKSAGKLTLAQAASPMLVFPFRPVMCELFRWADKQRPDWKWKYYEGLILWQANRLSAARDLFRACGDEPRFVPFWLARAELFSGDSTETVKALEKAYSLDPLFWRTGLKLSQFYARSGMKERALGVSAANCKAHPGSFITGLQYANMLRLNGQYRETLRILSGLEMLPAEGDVNAHSLFRETNILYALEQMRAGRFRNALSSLQKAETWPENLFSGEPYLADNRVTRFLAAYCSHSMKEEEQEAAAFAYISSYRNPDGWTSAYGNKLTSIVSSGAKDYRKIAENLAADPANDRDSEIVRIFLGIL